MGDVISFERKPLKMLGCSREHDMPNVVVFSFSRTLTEKAMRFLDDVMARAVPITDHFLNYSKT